MANPTVKLKLKFKDNVDKDTEMSWNFAKDNITGAQAKTLGDAIVARKDCFKNSPTTFVSASIITTTETPITLPV